MITTVATGRVYNFSHVVGRGQSTGTGFSRPTAIDLAQDGSVYVVNRGGEQNPGSRVNKITIGAPGDEEFICEFALSGEGNGQAIWPSSVALDREENVYVSDEWLNRISVFDKDGTFLSSWGIQGTGHGELNRPAGIAFDQEDNLYIVDSHSHRIQKFTKNGSFLATFGEEGDGKGQFSLPWGITIDSQGDIYVVDWGNHRVQKFSPYGVFLSSFGTFGSGVGELHYPTDVAVDGDGDVYVADWANHRVQIFAPDGDVITSLIGDAQQPSKWAQLSIDANPDIMKARRRVKSPEPEWRFLFPTAVAFDKALNRLFVVDCQPSRLQIYIKDRDYVGPQFNL